MSKTGKRRWKRRVAIALAVFLVLGASGFAWLWFAPCGMGGCAPVGELEKFQAEGSQLFDMRGQPIGSLAMVNRRVVSLDSLPEYLPRAVLAVEDRRFYDHGGVDWRRFLGALVRNVKARGVEEGGSTITMQLARNLFPRHLPYRDRSLRRKVLEVRVARQIERAFDKKKILELYLNHIYLGEGAYGVEAASRVYFGKPAAELALHEAALIAGLAQSPSRLNPLENKDGARRRRNLVLREMAKAGYITAEQAREATAAPVRVRRRSAQGAQRHAWFIERVRRELEERIGTEFYTAGLRVHTTLDPLAQRAAEEELARQADAIEAGAFGAFRHPTYPEAKGETEDGSTPYLQGVAVVMEVADGAIRALVGGRDYDDSKFDRAFQGLRQPGSAFKPFVYLAALDQGLPASHRMEDSPVRLVMAGGETWEPRNYTGRYEGPMTLREALTRSKNTVTVKLAQEVGMGQVVRAAQRMGVTSPIPTNPAVALGSAEVKPIELVRAYAGFSSGGWLPEPHVIARIETRDGEVLYEAQPARERAIDPAVAYVLTTMLRDVVDRGTGTPARAAGFRGPAAGKTGTTNGATDIWFVGYTPDLVGAVWYGLDKPQTIVRGASGGTIAAPVWGRMMARIYARRRAPADWPMPRGVVTERVDRSTGLAVDETCPPRGEIYTEYFVHVRPARQVCYADYPVFAYDTAWYDEEVGAYQYQDYENFDPDTVGMGDLRSRGIVFPELEERRRRGDTLTRPLPGDVDGDGATGTRTPLPPPPSTEPRRPATPRRDPPPASGGDPPVLGRPVDPAPPPPTPADTTGAA